DTRPLLRFPRPINRDGTCASIGSWRTSDERHGSSRAACAACGPRQCAQAYRRSCLLGPKINGLPLVALMRCVRSSWLTTASAARANLLIVAWHHVHHRRNQAGRELFKANTHEGESQSLSVATVAGR